VTPAADGTGDEESSASQEATVRAPLPLLPPAQPASVKAATAATAATIEAFGTFLVIASTPYL
jgi:hypothetical protein